MAQTLDVNWGAVEMFCGEVPKIFAGIGCPSSPLRARRAVPLPADKAKTPAAMLCGLGTLRIGTTHFFHGSNDCLAAFARTQ